MDTAFSIFVLVVLSAFCWLMVLNPSARKRLGEPPLTFFKIRMSKDERAVEEATVIAIYLAGALLFSMITIAALGMAMARWLGIIG